MPKGTILRTSVSPQFLTYFMVDWSKVEQKPSDQDCTECGAPMRKTELVFGPTGQGFEGYVCHRDRRVVWVRVG